mgnify:CR=1 FL=1
MRSAAAVCIIALAGWASTGHAQTAAREEVKNADLYLVDDAKLYRVEDGVFTLSLNQTVDITDQYILLALVDGKPQYNCLAISVAGAKRCITIGARFDLKDPNQFGIVKVLEAASKVVE